MSTLLKVAQEFEDKLNKQSEASQKMAMYVGMLRGLAIIHQQAHWTSKEKEYYGDHLLFDRLYNDASAHIDTAFEKMIGVFGTNNASLEEHISMTKKFIDAILGQVNGTDNDSLAKRSLLAEEVFLKFSKSLYDWLDSRDELTLGVDDMIMAIASDHETFVYLLKQRTTE